MRHVVTASFIVVAIIHLLPLPGAIGRSQLSKLYGVSFDEPNTEILMRHRAVLFGLLGAFLLYAAFVPSLHPLAFVAGFTSVVSFLWITKSTGKHNPNITRVVWADIVALISLFAGLGAHLVGAM